MALPVKQPGALQLFKNKNLSKRAIPDDTCNLAPLHRNSVLLALNLNHSILVPPSSSKNDGAFREIR
jgi:hypothetical protein